MAGCSNPVQCQTAKRVECTCECSGINHSILRKALDSDDEAVIARAQARVVELKMEQEVIKKNNKIARRQRRASEKKALTAFAG